MHKKLIVLTIFFITAPALGMIENNFNQSQRVSLLLSGNKKHIIDNEHLNSQFIKNFTENGCINDAGSSSSIPLPDITQKDIFLLLCYQSKKPHEQLLFLQSLPTNDLINLAAADDFLNIQPTSCDEQESILLVPTIIDILYNRIKRNNDAVTILTHEKTNNTLQALLTKKMLPSIRELPEYPTIALSDKSPHMLSLQSGANIFKVWNSSTGALLNTLEHSACSFIRFNKDGSRILSASLFEDEREDRFIDGVPSVNKDKTGDIKVWDTKDGKCLATIHHDGCISAEFNHDDSKILSVSMKNHSIKLANAESGACLLFFESRGDANFSTKLNHDSSRIISRSRYNGLKLWGTKDGTMLSTFCCPDNYQDYSKLNRDGSRLISRAYRRIGTTLEVSSNLCNPLTNEPILSLRSDDKSIDVFIEFNHDGSRVFSHSYQNGKIYIWDSKDGNRLHNLEHPQCSDVKFSPDDSRILSRSKDMIKLWDAENGTLIHDLKHPQCSSTKFNHDGSRIISFSYEPTSNFKVWDAKSGECLNTFEGYCYAELNHDSSRIFLWGSETTTFQSLPVDPFSFEHLMLVQFAQSNKEKSTWPAKFLRIYRNAPASIKKIINSHN